MDQAKAALSAEWEDDVEAGSHDSGVTLTSEGERSCAARIVYTRMDGQATAPVEGAFSSAGCHAEMSALNNFYRANLDAVKLASLRIEIETQPCPRCAVVLNCLNLSGFVFYKSAGGYKDYPTWRFPPDVVVDWAAKMGVSEYASDKTDQGLLLNYFATHKWW